LFKKLIKNITDNDFQMQLDKIKVNKQLNGFSISSPIISQTYIILLKTIFLKKS